MQKLPMANSVPWGENKEKIASQARRKFSCALANDTKWNELIGYVRGLDDGWPPFRSKWVNGHISEWDTEWCYHLPFPFVGVEWFDIRLYQYVWVKRFTESKIVNHAPEIIDVLEKIGLDFDVRGDFVRIWGYSPKSYEDFPPRIQT